MSGFEPGFHMEGRGGTLVQGWNEITKIDRWVAMPGKLEDGHPCLRISVGRHEPDPYFFDYCDPDEPMSLEIKIGKTEVTKPARIASKQPLVIEAWNEREEE